MPTGVHHADILAVVGRSDLGGERHVDFFGHREGVHVGPQGDDRPGLPAFQHSHDAGMRHARAHLQTERTQVVCDELRGSRLAIGELGVFVNVPAPGNDFRLHLREQPVHLGVELA